MVADKALVSPSSVSVKIVNGYKENLCAEYERYNAVWQRLDNFEEEKNIRQLIKKLTSLFEVKAIHFFDSHVRMYRIETVAQVTGELAGFNFFKVVLRVKKASDDLNVFIQQDGLLNMATDTFEMRVGAEFVLYFADVLD